MTKRRDRVMIHWLWAEKAKVLLKSLIEGKEITIIPIERDIYDSRRDRFANRVICDWYLGTSIAKSQNIQLKLSEEGLCTHFLPLQQYLFPNRELNLVLGISKKSAIAASNKISFWKENNLILPADYKKLGSPAY